MQLQRQRQRFQYPRLRPVAASLPFCGRLAEMQAIVRTLPRPSRPPPRPRLPPLLLPLLHRRRLLQPACRGCRQGACLPRHRPLLRLLPLRLPRRRASMGAGEAPLQQRPLQQLGGDRRRRLLWRWVRPSKQLPGYLERWGCSLRSPLPLQCQPGLSLRRQWLRTLGAAVAPAAGCCLGGGAVHPHSRLHSASSLHSAMGCGSGGQIPKSFESSRGTK